MPPQRTLQKHERLSRPPIVPIATRFTRLFEDVATPGKTRKISRKIFLSTWWRKALWPGLINSVVDSGAFCWER